jgi:phage repressor protein C with HTH and peptisase S24 domain
MMTMDNKIRAILKASGLNQTELAERLNTTQATVSRWLKGSEPKGRFFEAINALYEELMDNAPRPEGRENIVPVMGYIGAGSTIEPDFEQVPPEGIFPVIVPFPMPQEMIAFQVKGDSMLPVYKDGFVIVVYKEQQRNLESFYGEDAAVRTSDGRRFIKTIQRGSSGVNLFSFNAPLIENVHLEWIGEIFAVLPGQQLKKVEKRGGIQGELRIASGG